MNGGLDYTAEDGSRWLVTLEAPGRVLSVPSSLEKAGGLIPEHETRIVFRSGDALYSAEYTSLSALEELSDADLQEWLEIARRGEGL